MRKVIKITDDSIIFDDETELSSDHEQDCCEGHYLSFSDLTMEDFEDLEFNLENDNFFNKIEDYGIELVPLKGHSVKIPGYGYNNGYYSTNLTLVLSKGHGEGKSYDISECQVIQG